MKSVLLGAAAALSVALSNAGSPHAQDRLLVNTLSGVWGTAQKECIFDPFSKAAGVTVVAEPGGSAVTLTKLIQQKSKPEIDVAWMDGGVSEQAWAAGVIDAIDPDKIPNLSGIVSQGIYKTAEGKIYALNTGFYATGLFYNTVEFKEKPTSWWDLWKPEYANRITAPGPAQSIFLPFLLHINRLLGGTSQNLEPAIQKFKALKASSYYSATGGIQSSIQTGEVVMGAFYVNATWALADQGVPVAAVSPAGGLPAGDIRVHLVKGTTRKALAEKFIDSVMSPHSLNCLAEKIYVGPPLKTPSLADKIRDRMPWGATGSINDLVIPDWDDLTARRPEINDIWNRRVIAQ